MASPKLKLDWFLIGIAAATALAWIYPDAGAQGGALHPEVTNKIGVALIFFLHGVALSFAALRAGVLRWPLHIVVQASTFLFFPLLGIALLQVIGERIAPELALGIFYLCALPSTVSSSVALTAAARGNVPAAVFNATLSSLLGVALTPLWVALWIGTGSGESRSLGRVMLDLMVWLVLPLALGQIARPWLGAWAGRNRRWINLVDRATILLLVYTSFCDSVKWGVWSGHGVGTLMAALVGSIALLMAALFVTSAVCHALGFARADRIAAVFCGSKKTLASGVPMARLIFGAHPGLSLILLPIMIYHPLQLIVCGALASRWAREAEDKTHDQATSRRRFSRAGRPRN